MVMEVRIILPACWNENLNTLYKGAFHDLSPWSKTEAPTLKSKDFIIKQAGI
jgi:hypothetical protein